MMNKIVLLIFAMTFIVFLSADPVPPVRMCAEWEPANGTLIRWPLGIPAQLVIELAEDDTLYTIVEDHVEEVQAINTYTSWNVNMEHCRFIYAETYSHWTRDWGPVSIFDGNGEWAIADPFFDGYPWVPGGRDWSVDDAVNAEVAEYFGAENYSFPAYVTGGNIMTDGHGTAFSSVQMVNENLPIMSEEDFFEYASDYLGITAYHIVSNAENHGIQHIDCSSKLLDEETILHKELPNWHPEYNRIETIADELRTLTNCYGRPYNIVRIFCDVYEGNSAAAYTNSLILNKKVFLPLFGIESDDAAIETYQNAMPGFEVIGFFYADWYYYDALHCRTRGIFDRYMLRITHRRLDAELPEADLYEITTIIDDRSEAGLIEDASFIMWKTSTENTWNSVLLEENADQNTYSANIPGPTIGTEIQYYITARDYSGRLETLPRTAPNGFYSFTIIEDNEADEEIAQPVVINLTNYPNPFNPSTVISFKLNTEITEYTELRIYNIKGQLVDVLPVTLSGVEGRGKVIWNARKHTSGIYFYKLNLPNSPVKKMIFIK